MEQHLEVMAASANPIIKIGGLSGLANYALMRGRLKDLKHYAAETHRAARALGQQPNLFADSLQESYLDLGFFDDTARAIRRVDAMVARIDFRSMPFDNRPYLGLAAFYANACQPAKARNMLSRWEADVPDSVTRRVAEPGRR